MTSSYSPETLETGDPSQPGPRWFLRGVRTAISLPGLLLCGAFIGFAAIARDTGLTLVEAVFMTAIIWALPAQIVLLGAMASGASLPAAAIAVTLTSVRLMPMVVSIVPEMRARGTRPWVLYLLSHFVAVTSWVLAMDRFRHVPRDRRTAFYGGIGATLVSGMLLVLAVVYGTAAVLPPMLAAGLVFLTPSYFLFSLWSSARERASHAAMLAGMVLGPLLHPLLPGFDLLAAGIIAGLGAFGLHLASERRGQGG
ncbi:AzlC family protein [Zhengella mangrovi]|uniref:AzlC family protein n=1 Tax=Zhengella mangrovi TaxID=1982044 RepID=A0A2G1QHU9_9HYPH|nr:AzlC family ABC transporter permease [Zhengella mangrovi]PHP65095.1 AzlC family protein [Zhengella mangrovi]